MSYLNIEFRSTEKVHGSFPDICAFNVRGIHAFWETISNPSYDNQTRNMAMLGLLHARSEVLQKLPSFISILQRLEQQDETLDITEDRRPFATQVAQRLVALVNMLYARSPSVEWPAGLSIPRWMPRLVSKYRNWLKHYAKCTGELMGLAITHSTVPQAAIEEFESNLTAFPGTFEFAMESARCVARGLGGIKYHSKRLHRARIRAERLQSEMDEAEFGHGRDEFD